MLRKLGVLLCLVGFGLVCFMALTSEREAPFAGLAGIQSNIANQGVDIVEGRVAGISSVTAKGRQLVVALPESVANDFDRDALQTELEGIEGVRSVEITGDPTRLASPTEAVPLEDAPAPVATGVPESAPEPTPEPTPESTAVPEPPSLSELVDNLDLGRIEFTPGTAELTGPDQAVLNTIAAQLVGQSGGPIEVQGHTDDVGDPDVNFVLSQERAEAVRDYLLSRGVDTTLLTARGFGASKPIADNSTEQGRADNQRVAFVVEGN